MSFRHLSISLSNEKRIAELDKILTKIYEDRGLEVITDERYKAMSATYDTELTTLNQRNSELLSEISEADKVFANAENFVGLIKQYTDTKELNTKILNELVDKILIYEKTTNPDGSKSQRVDIYYKFIGYVHTPKLAIAVDKETA